ncbi:MarR family winged helix-turn-helix transcriptional regulator [Paenibacillus sp. 22594]|uniref:MarR family winged helix-turn-helix transcriptional regulator n=1 Tax=Paenibacillus sp. 22594 TaxID=3453947 RepID=UPI003F837372
MNEDRKDKYDNIDELMAVFQQFSKINWQKNNPTLLKPSEIRVLVTIKLGTEKSGKPVLTISDISKMHKVTSPTITQMVNSLLAQGYVVRTSDAQDKRVSGIALTDKGERYADAAVERIRDTFKGMIDYLGKERSETLIELLNGVYHYFEELNGQLED